MNALLKAGTCLGVEPKNRLRQQEINGAFGLCSRDYHHYPARKSDAWKIRNLLLIYLILDQLFHFCVQNYKKNPDL